MLHLGPFTGSFRARGIEYPLCAKGGDARELARALRAEFSANGDEAGDFWEVRDFFGSRVYCGGWTVSGYADNMNECRREAEMARA